MVLLGLLLMLIVPAVLALIGLQFAEDRDEELLYLKLFGHAILGAFTFRINGFPLPIGILIALWMASNATINKKAAASQRESHLRCSSSDCSSNLKGRRATGRVGVVGNL